MIRRSLRSWLVLLSLLFALISDVARFVVEVGSLSSLSESLSADSCKLSSPESSSKYSYRDMLARSCCMQAMNYHYPYSVPRERRRVLCVHCVCHIEKREKWDVTSDKVTSHKIFDICRCCPSFSGEQQHQAPATSNTSVIYIVG
jgi:hypothetical protein